MHGASKQVAKSVATGSSPDTPEVKTLLFRIAPMTHDMLNGAATTAHHANADSLGSLLVRPDPASLAITWPGLCCWKP
jgi:hypothetical protein